MPNSFSYVTKFQAILDELYKKASLTSFMDAKTKPVTFGGASAVNVYKTDLIGLGTYSRATGYPNAKVTGSWETLTLAIERARSMSIDRMDDEETLGMAFGTTAGEFIRTKVVPEIDAYRFAKYATRAGTTVGTPAALTTGDAVMKAFDVAMETLDENEVPAEGRKLFISSKCYNLLKAQLTRVLGNEKSADRRVYELDGVGIIPVPQARFYSKITLDPGGEEDEGGFSKNSTDGGKDINFLLLHPSAVLQATKLSQMKVFSPDVNQAADAWLIQYRHYHDAFVYDNKVKGVYSHIKNT